MSQQVLMTLSQAATAGPATSPWPRVIALILILVVLLIGAVVFLKRLRAGSQPEDEAAVSQSLLGELQRLRKSGELTDAEYSTAREALSRRIATAVESKLGERSAKRKPPPIGGSVEAILGRSPGTGSGGASLIPIAERTSTDAKRTKPASLPMRDQPLRARPGFDLTGAPLPVPKKETTDRGGFEPPASSD